MSENQHWVPKFLVRNFADSDGRVFRLDIQDDSIAKLPPKRAAARVNFNEFLVEGKTVSYEDDLEKIETKAAPALRRVVSTGSLADLTTRDRRCVSNFVAAQTFRTEAFYKGLRLDISRADFGLIFNQLWRSAFLVSREIERRIWAVMTIANEDVFYLGDNPVVLQNTENPAAAGQLGFDIKGIEAFLPLSPKCALYMPCRSHSEEIVSGYKNAVQLREQVRSSILAGNLAPGTAMFTNLAERTIESTSALAQALMTGSAIAATRENVENLNYLQCAWAHTAVYSSGRDFSFAMRVFEENPQYRGTVETALHEFWPHPHTPQGAAA